MTPTPAQIEAAAEAINHALFDCGAKKLSRGEYDEHAIAKAALTAAAEVGDSRTYSHGYADGVRDGVAAAEVGQQPSVEDVRRMVCRNKVADTIERCGQVAIDWRGWLSGNREPTPEEIAAAIMALKDKP